MFMCSVPVAVVQTVPGPGASPAEGSGGPPAVPGAGRDNQPGGSPFTFEDVVFEIP